MMVQWAPVDGRRLVGRVLHTDVDGQQEIIIHHDLII